MTRDKGTNVNNIHMTLASCMRFCSPKDQGEKDCLKKAKNGKFMQHGQKAESIIIQQTSKGRQNSKRDITMADYVYPNILLESTNPLSRRDVCIQ